LIFISVMAGQNHYLPQLIDQARKLGLSAVNEAIFDGKELPDESGIPWRAFSRQELESMASDLNCEVLTSSASNVLASVPDVPLLEEIEKDEVLWKTFLRWEEHLAQLPANVERGSHIIAVLRKNS
jgi:hypothetical protein